MSANSDFFLARAAQSAREASETDLMNVRERCLRSEKAWRVMADRMLRSENGRKQQAGRKIILGQSI